MIGVISMKKLIIDYIISFEKYGVGFNDAIEEKVYEKEQTDLFEICDVIDDDGKTIIHYRLL